MIKKFLCFIGIHRWKQISDIVDNPLWKPFEIGYFNAPFYWEEKCEWCGKERVGY